MPSPVYVAGTPGNLASSLAVTPGATAAVLLDISTDVEGQLTCELIIGSTAPTAPTTFDAYGAYAAGSSAPLSLSGSAASGTTALPLNASGNLAGLHTGQKVAVISASSGVGEIVTLSATPSGTGAQSVGCSTLINSYASGDHVYLMASTPTAAVAPADPSSLTWAPSTDYSSRVYLGASQYIIGVANTDAAANVTVALTLDKITAIQ